MAKVVISVHGIRTRGVWQKEITPLLGSKGWIVYPLDYGRFGLPRFCFPPTRNPKIDWFRDEYTRIRGKHGDTLSVIAHSFGTYIVAAALEKYEAIKLQKIIFCGSIVDPNYNWRTILNNQQVMRVRNDYGKLDVWSRTANKLVGDAGPSGYEGFKINDPRVINKEFKKFGHSDYFSELHFETYWIPFLEEEILNLGAQVERESNKTIIISTLERITKNASLVLGIDQRQLRANIFLPVASTNVLKIPEAIHTNMKDLRELTISIPIGSGCTGNAYQNKEPTIAVLEQSWGKYILDEPEMKKVHSELVKKSELIHSQL